MNACGVVGEDELAQLALRFNQMAEKLNQVESLRRRLIGDVSHELCTLLTWAGYLLIRPDLSDKRGLLSCCFIAHNILGAA